MAWNDPSPRNRGSAGSAPSANPGYADTSPQDTPGVSLGTILARSAAALAVGALVYTVAHAALVGWHLHNASHSLADKAVALALAIVVAGLFMRMLSNPGSWRLGDGSGWLGGRRRRAWDDDYDRRYPTLGEQVVADVVEGVIDGVARAID